MVESGSLIKLERGIYLLDGFWEDEFVVYSLRYRKGIFSHATALYLHGLTDRTPAHLSMTFPQGYNTVSLANPVLDVHRTAKSLFLLGGSLVATPSGNKVRVYDIERTLCDIVRGSNGGDVQVVNQAMKRYVASKNKDIQKLLGYAERLRVKPRILNYMEVLL
jgi:predicted transcriptional regulator of viral defense system